MENEKTLNEESVQDTTVESTETEKTVELKYSEEDMSKAIQSATSKGKGDILKELGIGSVKEFKEMKKTYETAVNEKANLETQLESLTNKLICKNLNVKDDVSEDFIDLAKKRVKDGTTFEDAAKAVAELYPNMLVNNTTYEKTGIEKKTDGGSKQPQYSEEMLRRYPHLRNNKKI